MITNIGKVSKTLIRAFSQQKYSSFSQKTNLPNKNGSTGGVRFYVVTLTIGSGLAGTLYDGYNEFEYIGAANRFLRSLKIAVTMALDYSWNMYGLKENSPEYTETLKTVNLRSAHRLLNGCLANGGLYIKIGQGVSAINHILPKEFTETLAKLENECLPRKSDEIRKVFAQEFGKEPEELFVKFNYEPIAAASLAQVFRATTMAGDEVAVKVQYIDLQKRFSGDFGTIQFIQNLVKFFYKNYNFGWILNDLRGNLEQELDFVNEGKNGEKCASDLEKFKFVHVPKVHWDLTTSKVLTAEWIDGYKISDVKQIKQDKLNMSDIDKKLFTIFSEQIFGTGFVHADPHPGNVLIRKNVHGKPEIILLDHGLYEKLPLEVRNSLSKFWEAIILRDINHMKEYAKELQVDDYDKLAEVLLQRPFQIDAPRKAWLTDEELQYMAKMAKERFDSVLNTLKQMPRPMIFVIRNLNTIRAIARNHGDPIDRPIFMARYAQQCIYRNNRGLFTAVKKFFRRIRFEFHLFQIVFKFWALEKYLSIITKFKQTEIDDLNLLMS